MRPDTAPVGGVADHHVVDPPVGNETEAVEQLGKAVELYKIKGYDPQAGTGLEGNETLGFVIDTPADFDSTNAEGLVIAGVINEVPDLDPWGNAYRSTATVFDADGDPLTTEDIYTRIIIASYGKDGVDDTCANDDHCWFGVNAAP